MVNLVKNQEKPKREIYLAEEYKAAIQYINQDIEDSKDYFIYEHIDMKN